MQRAIYMLLKREQFRHLQGMRHQAGFGYTFQPFDAKKCIFVRIPKCATQSISQALFGNMAGGHTKLRKYALIFGSSLLHSYFTFTIVRNPWDRILSAYLFLKKGGASSKDREWGERHLSRYDSFDSFVKGWVTPNNIHSYLHFQPQYQFIRLHGDLPAVDFVGRFENLEQDFITIRDRLELEVDLPSLNRNKSRRPYSEYYTEESAEIVRHVYQKDVTFFNYSFEV